MFNINSLNIYIDENIKNTITIKAPTHPPIVSDTSPLALTNLALLLQTTPKPKNPIETTQKIKKKIKLEKIKKLKLSITETHEIQDKLIEVEMFDNEHVQSSA